VAAPRPAPAPTSHGAILAAVDAARTGRLALVAALAVTGLASLWLTGMLDGARLLRGLPAMRQLASEMVPPDFSRWRSWLRPLLDTLAMSVAGTAVSVLLSVPLALLAAQTTTPGWLVHRVARVLLNFLRSVPELVMGIFFVAAVGFGALPGVLALGLHSTGMVAKFFAEAIEHADPRPIEAIRATGAAPLQVITHAVLPQVLSRWVDTALYRWEYNFRASTVLGVVGAGGIGFELVAALRIMAYDQVAAVMLCILGAVTVVDLLGGALRLRLR
jgi:phosphonate transport system permease protein